MQSLLTPFVLLLMLAACSDDTEITPQAGAAGQAQGGSGGHGEQGGQRFQELRSQVPFNETPDLEDAQKVAFVRGNNAFGFDLYREMIKAPEAANNNLFLSPLSVSFALGMTSAGAKGDTLAELEKVLQFSLPQPTIHAGFNWIKQELMARPADGLSMLTTEQKAKSNFDFNLVNSLWVRNEFKPVPAFLDLLAKEYNAGLTLQDFVQNPEGSRQNINGWVEQETKQRLRDLLPAGSITHDTRIVLVNAVSLGAPWHFPLSSSGSALFTTLDGSQVDVPMMTRGDSGLSIPYLANDDLEAISLPLLGGKLSVLLVVPQPGKFTAVEASLDAAKFEAIQSAMHYEQVAAKIPRFKFTSPSVSLLKPLRALGLDQATTDSADFSGISTPTEVKIADVIHKVMVSFDEDGIEAAAVTAVTGEGIILGPPPAIPFVVDRPFFLAIKDVTGAVLFWGRITRPEEG